MIRLKDGEKLVGLEQVDEPDEVEVFDEQLDEEAGSVVPDPEAGAVVESDDSVEPNNDEPE